MNQDIRKLVEKYESDRDIYLTDRYNETQVRSDFLDPLFELLGWDIKNKAGRPTNEREVILEEPLKAGASENTKIQHVYIGNTVLYRKLRITVCIHTKAYRNHDVTGV